MPLDEPEESPRAGQTSPSVHLLEEENRRALADPESYWTSVANDLHWEVKGTQVFERSPDPPYGRWFEPWRTNLAFNTVRRHASSGRRDQVAFHWEGEDRERRSYTFGELDRSVGQWAAALASLGVMRGDRVTFYLPMIPELPLALLATAWLGATHSVIFSGYASQALADRIQDAGSRLVVTADGAYRRGKVLPLKPVVDEALRHTPLVQKVVVVSRTKNEVGWVAGRDLWATDLLKTSRASLPPAWVEGTHPAFLLYTSGTTGKPKGVVHGTGGYMVWLSHTMRRVFDLRAGDRYWCTADIGWITGHSYVLYGPLLSGSTSLLYEGAPDFPSMDRWWELIERYRVSVLYTTPTAIRMHMKQGTASIERHDLTSLRLLGTVGEAINPEAWRWYHQHVGGSRCPIVDTWWQTETGGILVSPQPGAALVPLKPGSATLPLPGVDADIVDEEGKTVPRGQKGFLVIRRPWPGEFIGLWRDPERYARTYFGRFPGLYYPGDYAVQDSEGYLWFLGRADEVLKVSGHRIGTIEIESALVAHPSVAEAAVVGKSDPVKMQVPVAFVVLRNGQVPSESLRRALIQHVRDTVGPIAQPSEVYLVDRLPKTRSGKIMRRLVHALVEGTPLGDASSLEDETSLEEARRAYEDLRSQTR